MGAVSGVRRRLIVAAVAVLTLALLPALAAQRSAIVSASVGSPASAQVGSQQPGIAWEPAAEGLNPPQDLNASPDYRRHLATVLTRRALEEVTRRA